MSAQPESIQAIYMVLAMLRQFWLEAAEAYKSAWRAKIDEALDKRLELMRVRGGGKVMK